jgi:hypothetical protein
MGGVNQMTDRRYLIDYEISGSLIVESSNPQAAAARAQAVLRAIAKGLNDEGEAELQIRPPVDLASKTAVQ